MFLDYEKYINKVKKVNDIYWNSSYDGRWDYMYPVIEELKKIGPKTALELGTYKISLMDFSDTMGLDLSIMDKDNLKNKTFIQDAKKIPWTIKDKEYDVFVALQVLEHLSPSQQLIFEEIKRISKFSILTLPYLWNTPNDKEHHMITENTIKKWTNNETPYRKLVIGSPDRLRMMVCFKHN